MILFVYERINKKKIVFIFHYFVMDFFKVGQKFTLAKVPTYEICEFDGKDATIRNVERNGDIRVVSIEKLKDGTYMPCVEEDFPYKEGNSFFVSRFDGDERMTLKKVFSVELLLQSVDYPHVTKFTTHKTFLELVKEGKIRPI